MKESKLEDYLEAEARKLGGLAAKHVSPGRAGDPDRLVALPARACPACGCTARVGLLELKREGKEPELLQAVRIEQWEAVGVPAGWAATRASVDGFLARLARPGLPGRASW
jgi:hypothetical protein